MALAELLGDAAVEGATLEENLAAVTALVENASGDAEAEAALAASANTTLAELLGDAAVEGATLEENLAAVTTLVADLREEAAEELDDGSLERIADLRANAAGTVTAPAANDGREAQIARAETVSDRLVNDDLRQVYSTSETEEDGNTRALELNERTLTPTNDSLAVLTRNGITLLETLNRPLIEVSGDTTTTIGNADLYGAWMNNAAFGVFAGSFDTFKGSSAEELEEFVGVVAVGDQINARPVAFDGYRAIWNGIFGCKASRCRGEHPRR